MKDASALKAWRSRITPEQALEWRRKISEGMKRRFHNGGVVAKRSVDGVKINISAVKHGRYVQGSSRTIIVNDVDWNTADVRDKLAAHAKILKEKGAFKRKGMPGIITI